MSSPNTPDPGAALPPVQHFLVAQAERAIDRADTKAATLGAAAIAVLTVLTTTRTADAGRAFLIAGSLSWAGAILALVAALVPRTRPAAPGTPAVSFCDLPEEYDADGLRAQVRRASEDVEGWLLALEHVLARIAVVKFRMIRLAVALLVASGVLAAVGMLIS
jgi:hypothetical protein